MQLKLSKKAAAQELFLDTFHVLWDSPQHLVWSTQRSRQTPGTAAPLYRCLVISILHELTREGTQMSYTILAKTWCRLEGGSLPLFCQQDWTTDKNSGPALPGRGREDETELPWQPIQNCIEAQNICVPPLKLHHDCSFHFMNTKHITTFSLQNTLYKHKNLTATHTPHIVITLPSSQLHSGH